MLFHGEQFHPYWNSGYRPSYQCQDINTTAYLQRHDHNNISDINVQYDKCKINIFVNSSDSEYKQYTEGCLNGYSYDIPDDRSTVTEVERSELAKTMIMLGQAVGAVIFSPIADREINIIALEETHELNPGKENGLKKEKVERYTVFTLLKHKRILLGSVVLWIAWIGRKSTLVIFHGIAGVSLVLATVCTTYGSEFKGQQMRLKSYKTISKRQIKIKTESEYSWLPILGTVFSFVGRFAITGSFSTVFLYTPELYPTNLRIYILGTSCSVRYNECYCYHFFILTLPETMGRELPTTITELKDWYKDKGGHGTKAKH
ncbi:unnamed protein product [Mytilus edulis]|uniref:Uncharacterized protein n=1 Tax=Mytilus edulis TaxID=6550 RepID=A0A8S3UUI6_MYTED|nr:unnamed protein product [Mytilus edulis]